MYPYYGMGPGVGAFTGRIGALGNYQIVGAPLAFGGMPPPNFAPQVRPPIPGPFGMPQHGPMGGPIPGMGVAATPQSDAYSLALAIPSSGAVAAAASATIAVVPQRPMRIERFTTTSAAGVFTVNNILAGVDSQFIGAGSGIDAAVWGPGAFGVAFRGSTVYPGITITISITNISAASATAIGWAFLGTAIA